MKTLNFFYFLKLLLIILQSKLYLAYSIKKAFYPTAAICY